MHHLISDFKRNKNKYTFIYNNSEYIFIEDTIIKYNLYNSKNVDSSLFDEIINYNLYKVNFTKMVNLLTKSIKSEHEIKNKLKSLPIIVQNDILIKLKDYNFLNDKMYVKLFVERAIRNKKGPAYIKNSLVNMNIDHNIIDEGLTSYSYELQREVISDYFIKNNLKSKLSLNKYIYHTTQKFYANGFDYDTINSSIRNLELIDNTLDILRKDFIKLRRHYDKEPIIKKLMNKGYKYNDIKKIMEEEE